MKGKLNNLMIQLRKNCNHPDLLQGAYEGSGNFLVMFMLFISIVIVVQCLTCYFLWSYQQHFTHLLSRLLNSVESFVYLTGYWSGFLPATTKYDAYNFLICIFCCYL